MKKLACASLAAALSFSLAVPALAADHLLITSKPGYSGTIAVNGEMLDVSGLPAAPASDSVPLRAVAEADYGFADWYPDEHQSFFALDTNRIFVDTTDGAIEVNGETVSGARAVFVEGTTFVPVSALDGLVGYTFNVNPALDVNRIDVATPNGEPLTKLAREIIDHSDMGAGMKHSPAEMEEYYGVTAANFTEVVGFFPMMISADTVVIGKVADGRMDAAKEELEAVRAKIQQGFEQYLPGPLERAKNGRVVTQGDYVILIISGDNDTAVALFKDGVE